MPLSIVIRKILLKLLSLKKYLAANSRPLIKFDAHGFEPRLTPSSGIGLSNLIVELLEV